MKHANIRLLTLFSALLAFPAVSRADQKRETCSMLSEMLFDTQLRQRETNAVDYALMEKTLKETFRARCNGGNGGGSDDGTNGNGRDSGGSPAYTNGQPMLRGSSWVLPDGNLFQPALFTDAAASAPILQPFLSAHRRCAPGCGYVSWGIWGDEAHQRRRSCHNSGQAIDIHAITCGGTHSAGSARFNQYVSCMRGSLGVIYGNASHRDHAHFQLHGCSMCQGKNCGAGRVPKQEEDDAGDDEDHD